MKQSSIRLFSILGSIALFIGAIFIYQSLISPAYDQVIETRGEKNKTDDAITTYKNITEKVQKMLSAYQNYAALQASISAALPVDSGVGDAVNQITKLASVNNMSVNSVDVKQLAIVPSKSALVKATGTLRFSLKLSGSYESFKGYVNALETNIRLIGFNSIKIEKAGTIPNLFNFTMEVDAYYQTQ